MRKINFNKIITLIIALVLLICLPTKMVFADDSVVLSIESKDVTENSTFTVSVDASNVIDAIAVQFTVQYDANKLEVISATRGQLVPNDMSPSINTNVLGKIYFAWDTAATVMSGSGTIMNIQFRVKQGVFGSTLVQIIKDDDLIFADENYSTYDVVTQAGTINIFKSLSISFDANGGQGQMDNVDNLFGESITLPVNTFTKENSLFVGWHLVRNIDNAYYVDGRGFLSNETIESEGLEKTVISDGSDITISYTGNDEYDFTCYAIWAFIDSGNVGDISWSYNEYVGSLIISGEGDMPNLAYANVPWLQYKDNIKIAIINEGVTSIGEYSFCNCSNLTSIAIPNSVTSIGQYAIYGCSNLASITIPDSVTSIGRSALSACSSLTSINIPNLVTSIDYCAFRNCTSLSSISIPNSVISIDSYAFENCANLTSITIPDSVTSINNGAFYACSSLSLVTILNADPSINNNAFYGCPSNLVLASYENTYLQQYCTNRGFTYLELSKISNEIVDGTLKSNGTVNLDLKVNVDDSINKDTAYVLVDGAKTILSDLTVQGDKYVVSTPGLAPKNLGDNITVRYYDGDDNPISKEIELSVVDYINSLIQGSASEAQENFYKSLLNYSANAQLYFDYNTDNLANANLSESDKDLSGITYDNVSSYAASVEGSTEGISAYGESLTLNEEVSYKVYFKLDGSHSINEYEFKDGDNKLTPRRYNDIYYYVTISRMAAPDLDASHTISVKCNGVGTLNTTCSVLTYAEITLRHTPSSEQETKLANLMKAMYNYSMATKATPGK